MSHPWLSVIMPTYNGGAYLEKTLASIAAQGDDDVEVIALDDGSTDDTRSVLAGYGDRIIVVPGEHRGLAAARNVGLARARGRRIAFHDADDVAMPRRLAIHRALLEMRPDAEAIFCNGERMDDPARRMVPSCVACRLPAEIGRSSSAGGVRFRRV